MGEPPAAPNAFAVRGMGRRFRSAAPDRRASEAIFRHGGILHFVLRQLLARAAPSGHAD
ncbi:MAG: hypothetical protein ACREJ5_16810 [Geminicoccaceae bacterium]